MTFDFFELAKQFGPFVAFTVYFIWQGWQRENRHTARIDELSDKYNNSLQTQLTQTTAALANNTKVMEESVRLMQRMEKLIGRICRESPGTGCED